MGTLSRRDLLQLTGGAVAGSVAFGGAPAAAAVNTSASVAASWPGAAAEPDVETALTWWTPQRQVWTPVGWKGHLFRYEMFYNGTMVCHPAVALPPSSAETLKPYLTPYKGKDFQVTPVLPDGGGIPSLGSDPDYLHRGDFGVGIQGWDRDRDTPVLWTEWRRQEGLVLRQTTFAHVKGGGPVDTADEPIYAWTRYTVEHVDPLQAPHAFDFVLRLSKVFVKHVVGPPEQQEAFITMRVDPAAAPLDGELRIDRIWNPDGKPLTVPVYDADDNVRMIVGTPAGGTIRLGRADGHERVYDLRLGVPVEEGTHVDVLVPVIPQGKDEAMREWDLGRNGALDECEAFWRPTSGDGATIRTPERHVTEFFRRSVQLAEVIAEKSPDSGEYTFLSGSYGYDLLWSTPTSMISHMFLDLLGRHEVVARHIELYLDVQGTREPPGTAYEAIGNDGFFATPLSLQSFDWLGDHGAILEAAARHALLSRDQEFIDTWTDPIVAACDFIKRAVEYTDHDGVAGLLPAAKSNDTGVEQQSVWIQVWNYKGLRSSVQLLRRIGHPRADELGRVADDFEATFVQAMRDAAASAPTWTDPDGSEHPVLPAKFSGPDSPWPFLEQFDTGALTAVWAGLMSAHDPLMRSFVEFFRVGPNTELFDPMHHTALDRVVLDHEQSSGEPCYSWNVFHSWQRGDRAHFLEGMYGLIAGACSPDTYIAGEHRNAMYGTLFVQPLITWAARHAVVDDSIAERELHLLRLCPLAWVSSETETVFDRMPTLFGPVDLRFRLSSDRRTLTVRYERPRERPRRTVLHPPPVPGLRRVVVNGRRYGADNPIAL